MDIHIEQDFSDLLKDIVGEENVKLSEEMKKHITFRVGGPADYFVVPHCADEVAAVFCLCKEKEIPIYILGNGSNLLIPEEGVRGVVVKIAENMNAYSVDAETNTITAEAGVKLSKCASVACEAGLSGLEFAAGIPGTIGGGVTMNAGAYGGELSDCIVWAKVLNEDGDALTLTKKKLELGYRESIIAKKNYVVLEAAFQLENGDKDEIRAKMQDFNRRRREKQPLEYPSAGSTFKRPTGHFAGQLIEEAGMKGYTIGGAMVSEKHAGFVINKGDATAADISNLIAVVQQRVRENSGVDLEPEVKCWK